MISKFKLDVKDGKAEAKKERRKKHKQRIADKKNQLKILKLMKEIENSNIDINKRRLSSIMRTLQNPTSP